MYQNMKTKREEWINSRIKILLEEEHMTEEQAICYLEKICDTCDREGSDYDEAIFRNWLILGTFTRKYHKENEVEEFFNTKLQNTKK